MVAQRCVLLSQGGNALLWASHVSLFVEIPELSAKNFGEYFERR